MSDHTGVGAPRKRKEDPRFLTGASCFTDDIALAGQLHGVVVRSPHAHARIRAVDLAAALAAPGVRLVLTAVDIEREVVRPIPSFSRTPPFDIRGPDGAMAPEAEQFPLAGETARYAGQPVVFVVAETLGQAQDAAELVRVDYEPRAAAIGIEQALGPEAPLVWDDRPSNVSFEWEGGDGRAVEAAFARAAHVTRVEVINNRIAPVFINPLIVHGQMHGGAAQGIGQALMEHVVFEAPSGQPMAGSFMDYAIPRADDLPFFTVGLNELAEPDNPLGVKGAGENATTGAPAAVMNALSDALHAVGAGGVDMPATREQVWRALDRARASHRP